jgi:ATP-binding cassette subfamily B protein
VIGGGGWGGGGGMGGQGGGQPFRGGANSAAAAAGLPFAGIPSELQAGVDKLTSREPEWPLEHVPFSHKSFDRQPLTMRRMFAPHWKAMVLMCLIIVVETASLQAGPLLTKIGIDDGIVPGNLRFLIGVGLAYVGVVVLTGLMTAVRLAYTGRVGQRLLLDLRLRVFAHQQRLSLDYYTREKAGVIMTRMTSDIEALNVLFQDGLVQLVQQGLTVIFVTVVLFLLDARLALITVGLVVPILTVFSIWFRGASERGYLRVRDGIAFVLSDFQESLSGVRVVAANNRQVHNIIHHRNVVGDYRDANVYTAKVNAIYGPGTDLLGLLAQAAILGIGGYFVLHEGMSIGTLTAFVLYLTAFFTPIQALTQFYNMYQQGQAAVTKLRQLLLEEPSVPEAQDAVELPPILGEIRLEGVTFGYDPATVVLGDVDLTIAAGETFSLVGPTGAGKSTIAKLVTRFYDPLRGEVLIDGYDLRGVTLDSLRRQLGVIPQEPFLFVGTIRDNIAFARPDAPEEDVLEAALAVGLGELLERLPDGLDTYVHERGTSLSAGERQLIALARTFLARPRVVVLDEATSNLDLRSETKVEHALDVLLEGRTAIIIAHRLSTAMRADRIGVVENGAIVELGSHDELIDLGGRYASMYATWVSHSTADVA